MNLHEVTAKTLGGAERSLAEYRGKVVLVVNVASECGFTPQYEGLQALYKTYGPRGFCVLAFPSNEFGAQEPGTDAEIGAFCSTRFGVTFDLFAKGNVKGDKAAPLFASLQSFDANPTFGGPIKWNFTKFLFGKDGKIAGRFESRTEPLSKDIKGAIEALLNA
jgi:glutathione peroxidase